MVSRRLFLECLQRLQQHPPEPVGPGFPDPRCIIGLDAEVVQPMDDDFRFVNAADHGQFLFPLPIEQFQIMVQYGPIALILEGVLRPEMLDFQDIRHANPLPERLNLHADIHVIQMETLEGAVVKPDGLKQFPGDEETHSINRDDIRDMVM